MEKIQSSSIIENHLNQHSFADLFSFDIKPYLSIAKFEPGEAILQEGTAPSHLYFLFEGRAKLYITQKNGNINLINFLESPCFIGEMELLDSTGACHGVTALQTCRCFSIDVSACRHLLLNDNCFLRNLCRAMSQKTLRDVQNYSRNQTYPLKTKLAAFILMTSRNGFYRERHTETAAYLGVSYRHLLYVLAEFVSEGVLEKTKSGYHIIHPDTLQSWAEW